jgi:hypothetical protein
LCAKQTHKKKAARRVWIHFVRPLKGRTQNESDQDRRAPISKDEFPTHKTNRPDSHPRWPTSRWYGQGERIDHRRTAGHRRQRRATGPRPSTGCQTGRRQAGAWA